MSYLVNPVNSLFAESTASEIYVDKSELIAHLNKVIKTEQKHVCATRPRRFGKSVNAKMLCAYYSKGCNSKALFDNLNISNDPSYELFLNKCNVISLNIQSFLSDSSGNIQKMLSLIDNSVISELVEIWPDAQIDRSNNLKNALLGLYRKTQETFVFVIDEWDCVFREYRHNDEAQKMYLDYLRNLFKDLPYVSLAYMTGILPIKKYGTHSALNMFREYSIIDSGALGKYFGFSTQEVSSLCESYNINFNLMNTWYDGYRLKDGSHVFNPNSVVNAVLEKDFRSYWNSTETYDALKVYIDMNMDGLRDDIISLIAGNSVSIDVSGFNNDMTTFDSKSDILTLLVYLGYLAVEVKKDLDEESIYHAYIPNKEIKNEFLTVINRSSNFTELAIFIKRSEQLLNDIWNMNEESVATAISCVHMENTSILSYNSELSLASVLNIALYNAVSYYTCFRELPTGKGFADLVYLPKVGANKPALIVELKFNKDSKTAIDQIKCKEYVNSLKDYQGEILLVGINYDKQTKAHSCIIEKLNKI